ncbi:MAG: hypothetical protein F6K54_10110 [Okeania sp. SIO3B5]|nr:hypothetical protein [Okeania sp. SIO3B5]
MQHTLYPTFRTTKCSIEEGVRRPPTPNPSPSQTTPSPSQEGETGDRILEENHSCRDQVHDQASIYA